MENLKMSSATRANRLEAEDMGASPAQVTMAELLSKSKFSRPEAENQNIIERNGERFTLRRAESGDDPIVSKVQDRLVGYFGSEEVDPEDIMRRAVDGYKKWDDKDGNPLPDITKYAIHVAQDSAGEAAGLLTGGRVDMFDAEGKPTGKQVFVVGYAMTTMKQRSLVDEAFREAISQAAKEAEAEGKQLAFVVGETNFLAEASANRVGMQLVYAEDPENPGSYKMVQYVQPALDFDKDTGKIAKGAGAAKEILTVGSFGQNELSKEDMLGMVRAIYAWNNTWPREAFSSDEAWEEHKQYINGIMQQFEQHLASVGELTLLEKVDRKRLEKEGRITLKQPDATEIEELGKGVSIQPLSEKWLDDAIALAGRIFPDEAEEEGRAEVAFPVSLQQEQFQEPLKEHGIRSLNYWTAMREGKVSGITGLYRKTEDPDDTVWVGWFGVDPDERGRGMGRQILDWTIAKAKADGFKKIRLYTSTAPNEAVAQNLYDEYGFNIFAEEAIPDTEYKTLYREKVLE